MRAFIDGAQAGDPLGAPLWAAAAFLGSAALLQASQVAATYVGEDVGWRTTNVLRADLLLHCLRLDMGFHTPAIGTIPIHWLSMLCHYSGW